ncbi:hypothetical protein ACHAQA_007651 [Verticillium albo-atrum]
MTTTETPVARALVQTTLHVVPGDLYGDKCHFLRNEICREVWNRDFDSEQDRWFSYGSFVGFDSRYCYLLVESGPHPGIEEPLPWQVIDLPVPPLIRIKVQRITAPKRLGRLTTPKVGASRVHLIKNRLRRGMKLSEGDVSFMKENPDRLHQIRTGLPGYQARIDEYLCG